MASPYLGGVHRHGGCCNQFRGIVSRAGEPTPAPIGGTHPSVGRGWKYLGTCAGGRTTIPGLRSVRGQPLHGNRIASVGR